VSVKTKGKNRGIQGKVKLEIVSEDDYVDEIVKIIQETAKTGEIGDGKIFVLPVDNAVRIRTGETGNGAV
jgi:nitrogen regulatory protein P-II 1